MGSTMPPPAQVRRLRRRLAELEREVAFSLSDQTSCCGVTAAQCHLLLEIEERGQSSLGELAAALELDPSTLSRTVDALVAAGLVSRAVEAGNRRRQAIGLSPTGLERVECINDTCDAYYSRLLDSMPEEKREAALDALSILAEAMRLFRKGGGNSCCENPQRRPS